MSEFSRQMVSRRSFLRGAGAAGVAAASLPALAAIPSAGPAQAGLSIGGSGSTPVFHAAEDDSLVAISMNEYPLGPAKSSMDAIVAAAQVGNRYHAEMVQAVVSTALDLYGLPRGHAALFPGSSGALNLALLSHIGPEKPLVFGDPSYELGPAIADLAGAPKFAVRLTPAYAHDVRAMVAATPRAGAYYIVNPNNPTGTVTPKQDIVWLLKHKPKGSVVVVDEAYHHFSNGESCIDLVAAGEDIIVTRTFSKIYGMAGLRAGLMFAKPEYFQRMRAVAPFAPTLASVSITTAAAAQAALEDKDLVPLRRKINEDNRGATLEFLAKHGYRVVPGSQANFFMVDVGRPGDDFQNAMLAENVMIGRTWASMPTYVRVSVGTREEMQRFQSAFVKCMDQPVTARNGASLGSRPVLRPSEFDRTCWGVALG